MLEEHLSLCHPTQSWRGEIPVKDAPAERQQLVGASAPELGLLFRPQALCTAHLAR
jgi:hypothetical protein